MKKLDQFLKNMKEEAFKYFTKLHAEYRETVHEDYDKAYKTLRSQTSKFMYNFISEIAGVERFKTQLNDFLEKDLKKKKEKLISRVEKKGGKIIDAHSLFLGKNNNLNGYIKCENKNVKVETIYAGGYHIQCLHYRVLVN